MGNYEIEIKKKDEIIFSAQGYASVTFSLKDSLDKNSYFITPVLNRYQIFLREVSVTAERELISIKQELDEVIITGLIQREEEYASPGSPVSFFYTRFSKKEKIERLKIDD